MKVLKKFLILLLCLTSVVCFATACKKDSKATQTKPTQVVEAELEFLLDSQKNTYNVVGIKNGGRATNLTIPELYNGLPITGISDYAFCDSISLTSATIGDNITFVGKAIFNGCSNLENLTVPYIGSSKSATSASSTTLLGYYFGDSAFTDSTLIQQYYSSGSYASCNIPRSLKNVTVLGGKILYGAFYGCKYLTNVTIGDNVSSIGSSAFYNCSALNKVTLGENVISIGSNAFSYCTKLFEVHNKSSIVIEPGVSSSANGYIGQYALNVYKDENGANKITTDENGFVLYADQSNVMLINYTGLKTEVTLPSNVTAIYSSAFSGNTSITKVVIGENVKAIGQEAFSDCTSLKTIVIGENVQTIGALAFKNCTKLKQINFNAIRCNDFSTSDQIFYNACDTEGCTVIFGPKVTTVPWYLFYAESYVPYLTKVEFDSNSVCHTIGNGAFEGCTNLKEVTIPASVTKIGSWAFYNNSSLKTVKYNGNIDSWVQINFVDGYSIPLRYATNFVINSQTVTSVTINSDKINSYAFYGYTKLTSAVIGTNVKTIGASAFASCSSLSSVEFKYTTNWLRYSSASSTSGSAISSSYLTSKTNAANYLRSTYSSYYWKRNVL